MENPFDVLHDEVFQTGEETGDEDDELEGENLEDIEHTELIRPMDSTPLLGDRAAANLWKLRKEKKLCGLFSVQSFFWGLFLHSWMVLIATVLAAVALVLFYTWNNPALDALPGKATLAWWCNFFARQIVTFEMARVLKYIIIDCVILGGDFTRIFGPFLTLFSLQARGWPFIIAAWGILDIILLQGDNAFQNHWLYFTGWAIYNHEHSSGRYILTSELYLRMLLCLVVMGSATAVKQTAIAISFGRRQYGIFKPRLKKLLLDVVLLNEVASLSAQIAVMLDESDDMKSGDKKMKGAKLGGDNNTNRRTLLNEVSWNSVRLKEGEVELDDSEPDEEKSQGSRGFSRSHSSESLLKGLLDQWQEPVGQDMVR